MKVTVRSAEIIYKELHFMDAQEVIDLYDKYAFRYHNLAKRKGCERATAVAKFRLRVWEFIKATVTELKDRGRWDEYGMKPIPIVATVTDIRKPMWVIKGLKPGTDKWKEHWKRYPKEQTGMAKHSMRQAKREGKNGKA
jgi:hypothetical protein